MYLRVCDADSEEADERREGADPYDGSLMVTIIRYLGERRGRPALRLLAALLEEPDQRQDPSGCDDGVTM